MTYVVGLDLSLTGTGIARILSSESGHHWVDHTRLGTDTAGLDLAARGKRLNGLSHRVTGHLARLGRPDLVLVEQPSYGSSGGSAHDRSGLWWLVLSRLTAAGVPVAEVTPVHLKMYATGAGKGGKDAVLAETARRYRDLAPELSTNDEADALILAAMAWQHVTGTPLVPLPATHTRTLDRIRWPSTPNRQEGTRA